MYSQGMNLRWIAWALLPLLFVDVWGSVGYEGRAVIAALSSSTDQQLGGSEDTSSRSASYAADEERNLAIETATPTSTATEPPPTPTPTPTVSSGSGAKEEEADSTPAAASPSSPTTGLQAQLPETGGQTDSGLRSQLVAVGGSAIVVGILLVAGASLAVWSGALHRR